MEFGIILDIGVILLLIAFIALGFRRGFLRSVLGLVKTIAAIIIAVLLARPLARLLDNWFSVTESLSGLFKDGPVHNLADNLGLLLLIVFCAIGLFILIRILVWFLLRLITKLKKGVKPLHRIDQILGAVFGLVKFIIFGTLVSGILLVLSQMSAMSWINDSLFERSYIASWLYDQAVEVMIPIIRSIDASAIFNNIIND